MKIMLLYQPLPQSQGSTSYTDFVRAKMAATGEADAPKLSVAVGKLLSCILFISNPMPFLILYSFSCIIVRQLIATRLSCYDDDDELSSSFGFIWGAQT